MKAYTWKQGSLTSGLDTVNDDQLGPVVLIGGSGRGLRYEKIKLDRARPAKVVDGKVLEAELHPMPLPPRGGRPMQNYYALRKPACSTKSVIVRICTQWAYESGSYGTWTTWQGTAKEIISGRGAHGEASRDGFWIDSLVVMEPHAAVQICPEGGHTVQPWALWLDNGTPQTVLWAQYEAAFEDDSVRHDSVEYEAAEHIEFEPDPDKTPSEWASEEVASSALEALRAKFAN